MTRGHSLAVLVSVAFQGRGLGHCRYAMSGRELRLWNQEVKVSCVHRFSGFHPEGFSKGAQSRTAAKLRWFRQNDRPPPECLPV